jgi:hypothetical protein
MKTLFNAFLIIFSGLMGQAIAGPADYVYRTYGIEGESDVIFNAGSHGNVDKPRSSAATLAFGHNLTDSWFSAIYFEYGREGGEATKFEAVSTMNIFRLTHGQYPFDVAMFTEIERPQTRAEGYKITFGPMIETEFGRTQANFNILFSKNYRSEFDSPLQIGYQWQLRHHWKQLIEPGLQGFGDMGKWDQWASKDEQSHRFGPAIFGSYSLGQRRSLQYNVAYLFETTSARQKNTLRLQTVFEF